MRGKSFSDLARLAAIKSRFSVLSDAACVVVHKAKLADAKTVLVAGRTHRAARRRAEVHSHRHPMVWAGSMGGRA